MIKLVERGRVIDMRKWFVLGNGNIQERAEWPPPLLDVKDEESLWGNRLLYRRNVLGKDGLTMRAIGELAAKGAGVDDVPRPLGPLIIAQGENRATDTVVPALRITDREDDLGIRMRCGQLAPEVRSWPIDNRLKAREERPPIDRLTGGLAAQGLIPEREPLLMLEVLHHVVTRPKPQAHESLTHRGGAGATESRPDDPQFRRGNPGRDE